MRDQELSDSELLDLLEDEDFYRALRQEEIKEKDLEYMKHFISRAFTNDEWYDFLLHCLENNIEPYKEMREIIYSTYGKILKKSLN
jgi:hypothetical protein